MKFVIFFIQFDSSLEISYTNKQIGFFPTTIQKHHYYGNQMG